MKSMIVYGSEYGTTRRYAESLSRQTGIPAADYKELKDLAGCGLIIHLGGLYAGGVKGLKRTVKLLPPGARLILVTVGLADVTDPENIHNIQTSVQRQLPAPLWKNTQLFHLRGGIDYGKLHFAHKTMMTLLCSQARRIPEEKRTAEVRAMIETFNAKVDFVDLDTLAPVQEAIRTALP